MVLQRELPQLHKKQGTALVLSGGVTKAFYFHLGVLRVLGLDGVTSIVGTSAGAVAGGLLAAGLDVETLITALDRKEITLPKSGAKYRFVGSRLLFNPGIKNIAAQGVQNGLTALRFIAALPGLMNQDVVAEAVDRLFMSQQSAAGFLDAGEIEAMFKAVLPSNSFSSLDIDFYATATALDTHERAVFNAHYAFTAAGSQFMTDVPVHQAVRASSSLPGVFEPVKIYDKYYIDGEIKQSLSLDIGLALADRVIVSHIYQPLYQANGQSLQSTGWLNILRQSFHLIMHERIAVWRELYAYRHPEKEILWIAPDPEDSEFFLAPEFSFRPEVQKRLIRSGEIAAEQALERIQNGG